MKNVTKTFPDQHVAFPIKYANSVVEQPRCGYVVNFFALYTHFIYFFNSMLCSFCCVVFCYNCRSLSFSFWFFQLFFLCCSSNFPNFTRSHYFFIFPFIIFFVRYITCMWRKFGFFKMAQLGATGK